MLGIQQIIYDTYIHFMEAAVYISDINDFAYLKSL